MSDKSDMLVISIGDHEQIATAIVDQAARQLLQHVAGVDEYGEPHYRESALSAQLSKKIDDAIGGYVKDIVEGHARSIMAKGVPQTNIYGEPVRGGETVTVAEMIQEKLRRELIDKKGHRDAESVLSRVIREEVDRALKHELHEEIKAAKARVKQAITDEAAKMLGEAVAREVGVK